MKWAVDKHIYAYIPIVAYLAIWSLYVFTIESGRNDRPEENFVYGFSYGDVCNNNTTDI